MRYSREDGCCAWLTYSQVGPDVLQRILEEFGSAEAAYDQFLRDKGKCMKPFMPLAQVDMLREQAQPEAMHQMMVLMQRHRMGILGRDDPRYPQALLTLHDPPALLFYQGDPTCVNGKCISMVGTRKAAPNTIETTRKIACDLSNSGVTIVSGMAVGIDTAAHEGCLDGKSPTAALLACGLDVDYPTPNHELKDRIIASGGVIFSEYPPGCPALAWHFPVRNRLIAALGRAVVMMEAQIRSGSMVTVHHALDQGKDVYAYPGNIGSEWAEGAHQLLREGALYFSSAKDILEDMKWDQMPSAAPSSKPLDMNASQQKIYGLLAMRDMSYDELAGATGFDAPTLSGELTMLSIMGVIQSLPGKIFGII